MTRTITTADLLDALPVKAVLLDEGGWPVWRDPLAGWCAANGTQDIPADLLLADGADDNGDQIQSGEFGGAQPAFTGDERVHAGNGVIRNDQRLQDAVFADGGG